MIQTIAAELQEAISACRANGGKQDLRDQLDRLAMRLMANRRALTPMSLDEWLIEHFDALTAAERRTAQAIVDAY